MKIKLYKIIFMIDQVKKLLHYMFQVLAIKLIQKVNKNRSYNQISKKN